MRLSGMRCHFPNWVLACGLVERFVDVDWMLGGGDGDDGGCGG